MCTTRPDYRFNNTAPMNEVFRFSNREDSVLPTPRGRIGLEMVKNPIRILNDSAFANEMLPKRDGV